MAIRGPKAQKGEILRISAIRNLNNGLQGIKVGTKILRGPSLKSLSLLRTFYLPQIMMLPISELKLSKLPPFGPPKLSKSWSVIDRRFWVGLNSLEILVPILTPCRPLFRIFPISVLPKSSKCYPFSLFLVRWLIVQGIFAKVGPDLELREGPGVWFLHQLIV